MRGLRPMVIGFRRLRGVTWWLHQHEPDSHRNNRPWVAPRSGGYSARPSDKPKPPPPSGPGCASPRP